jgi:hypothetical protein
MVKYCVCGAFAAWEGNMKSNTKNILVAGAFVAALGTAFFVGQASADQPHMQTALDALRTARSELNMATANKGGHRERALSLVDEAIDQVKAGMAYAE